MTRVGRAPAGRTARSRPPGPPPGPSELLYGYQVVEKDGATRIAMLSSQDVEYLDAQLGLANGQRKYLVKDVAGSTAWTDLAARLSPSKDRWYTEPATADSPEMLYRAYSVILPPGTSLQEAAAFIFDGSFQKDPDKDKFRNAKVLGSTLSSIKP